MIKPICPGCDTEMQESDVADYECLNPACGKWMYSDPESSGLSAEKGADK